MDKLLYIEKINASDRDAFAAGVNNISNYLNVRPDWLMQLFKQESDVNPQAINPITGAVGLIQFMPDTLAAMNLTPSEIRSMKGSEQLFYVKKHLEPYRNKISKFIDLYLAVFFPAAIGKPNNYILQTKHLSSATIAKQNPIYANGKIYLTVGDIETAILNKVPYDLRAFFIGKKKAYSLPLV